MGKEIGNHEVKHFLSICNNKIAHDQAKTNGT